MRSVPSSPPLCLSLTADQLTRPLPDDARRKRFRGNEPTQFKVPGKEGLGEGAGAKE